MTEVLRLCTHPACYPTPNTPDIAPAIILAACLVITSASRGLTKKLLPFSSTARSGGGSSSSPSADVIPAFSSASHTSVDESTTVGTPTDITGTPSVAFVSADQKDLTDVFFFAEREEFKDFAVMLKRWADKGFWSKSALSGSVFAKTQFANNQSAACINLMGDQEGTGMVSYLPGVEGAEAGFMDWPSMSGIFHYDDWMNDACAFPTNGNGDLGRTLMVYNALVTDEDYYMLAQYGFEGKNYVLDKDGYISLPDGVTDKTNTYSYGAAGLWPLRNSKYYHMSVNFDPATQDRHAYYDSIATENKLASFVLDTTEIQAEIAALEQANTQYLYPILYGQVKDVDEAIAAYVQAAKDAGCDRVVGEVKTQLEKYVSQYGY